MTTDDTLPAGAGSLYRTIWRWHFYAGLICLPFFILLATTGAIYLFRDQLEPVFEHNRLIVEQTAARPLAAETLIGRALTVQPGAPVRFAPPSAPDRSAEVGVRDEAGTVLSVFLEPSTGRVLDTVADDQRPMTLISHIHSLDILGAGPNLIIEIVAGLTLTF